MCYMYSSLRWKLLSSQTSLSSSSSSPLSHCDIQHYQNDVYVVNIEYHITCNTYSLFLKKTALPTIKGGESNVMFSNVAGCPIAFNTEFQSGVLKDMEVLIIYYTGNSV